MRLRRPRPILSLAALLCWWGSGCRSSTSESLSVAELIRTQRYADALQQAEAAWRDAPEESQAQLDYQTASVAILLAQTRKLSFQDRDDEALVKVEEARAILPGHPKIGEWHWKVLSKLSDRELSKAIEAHAADDPETAARFYETSLRFDPANARAKEGLARALLQLNYRNGMGEAYYIDGTQALSAYFLRQAHSLFSYTIKYAPSNAKADGRRAEVASLLADDRAALAEALEGLGQFAAAANEFRITLLIAPDHPTAQAGYERARNESLAAQALRDAERFTLRGEFEKAEAELARGRSLTLLQAESFETAVATIVDARIEGAYQKARALESDWRYEDAVVAYGELLERQQYYKDAIARRETLQGYIAQAARLYAEAESATEGEDRRSLYKRIEVFWPDYQDVRERLKALGPEPTQP